MHEWPQSSPRSGSSSRSTRPKLGRVVDGDYESGGRGSKAVQSGRLRRQLLARGLADGLGIIGSCSAFEAGSRRGRQAWARVQPSRRAPTGQSSTSERASAAPASMWGCRASASSMEWSSRCTTGSTVSRISTRTTPRDGRGIDRDRGGPRRHRVAAGPSNVPEWAGVHRGELRVNWDRAREEGPLERIDPP
jgi:hypothetical protein